MKVQAGQKCDTCWNVTPKSSTCCIQLIQCFFRVYIRVTLRLLRVNIRVTLRLLRVYIRVTLRLLRVYIRVTLRLLRVYIRVTLRLLRVYIRVSLRLLMHQLHISISDSISYILFVTLLFNMCSCRDIISF